VDTLTRRQWAVVAAIVAFLLGLLVLTLYLMLRRSARARLARMSVAALVVFVALGAAPWAAVFLAPISITMNVHGTAEIIQWSAAALGVYAGLVLLPAAVLCALVIRVRAAWRPRADPARTDTATR
jgi:hypothetical protein